MNFLRMPREQLEKLRFEFVAKGNHNASAEISDILSLYEKRVEVIKGRKVPVGTNGTCFWVKRYDNSKYGDQWGIYSSTRIGIQTDDGKTFFTNADNVKVID